MAHIHTLKDYEKFDVPGRPNPTPFPNAWSQPPTPQNYRMTTDLEGNDIPYPQQSSQQFQFMYIGIDGKQRVAERPSGVTQVCCIMCCPCFVPPFCNRDKREQYLGLIKSFCFFISVVQLIMLIVAISIGGGFVSFSINPSLGPNGLVFITLGGKYGYAIQQGQVWRYITPVLLHGGFLHLFFNVFAQLRFGIVLEKKWGLPKFLLLYIISGIGATLFSCLTRPNEIGVGASGAIMGLMGAFLSEIIMTWKKSDPRIRKMMLFQVILVISITMLFSISQYVDGAAHFGGLFVGFLIGLFYFNNETHHPILRKVGLFICPLILVIYFIVGFLVFHLAIKTEKIV